MERKMLRMLRKNVRVTLKEPGDMSTVSEARNLLGDVIGYVPAGTYLKTIFPSVARSLGVSVRRVETIWQGTARRIDVREFKKLEALAASKKVTALEILHANPYDAIANALEAVDPDFHRADIARYRGLARALRSACAHGQVA